MDALRALLFAVFGGFIAAAPAAPVAVKGTDASFTDAFDRTQKSERPGCELSARTARGVAAAPPHAGAPPFAAAILRGATARPPAAVAAAVSADRGRPVPPPLEDVRAGLLDLPPPAR